MIQKKKKRAALPILILVLLLLLAAWVLSGRLINQGKQEEEAAGEIVINRMEEITKLSYAPEDSVLTFIKEEGAWYEESDRDFPLEQRYLSALSDTLGRFTAVRLLDGHEEPEVYGFSEPLRTIAISDASGTSVILEIGNASGDNYYARIRGRDEIYTVASTVVEQTGMGLYEMIVPDVFPTIPEDAIHKIEITKNGETSVYEKTEQEEAQEEWKMLAGAAAGLSIGECVDYKPSEARLEKYGLAGPELLLKVTWNEEEKEQQTLLKIGNKSNTEGEYYAMPENSKAVRLISEDLLTAFFNASK